MRSVIATDFDGAVGQYAWRLHDRYRIALGNGLWRLPRSAAFATAHI